MDMYSNGAGSYTFGDIRNLLGLSDYLVGKLIDGGLIRRLPHKETLYLRRDVNALAAFQSRPLDLGEDDEIYAFICQLKPERGPNFFVNEWADREEAERNINAVIARLKAEGRDADAKKVAGGDLLVAQHWRISDENAALLRDNRAIVLGSMSGFNIDGGTLIDILDGGPLTGANHGRTFLVQPFSRDDARRYLATYHPSDQGPTARIVFPETEAATDEA